MVINWHFVKIAIIDFIHSALEIITIEHIPCSSPLLSVAWMRSGIEVLLLRVRGLTYLDIVASQSGLPRGLGCTRQALITCENGRSLPPRVNIARSGSGSSLIFGSCSSSTSALYIQCKREIGKHHFHHMESRRTIERPKTHQIVCRRYSNIRRLDQRTLRHLGLQYMNLHQLPNVKVAGVEYIHLSWFVSASC